jgi:putative ABC transport system ATP-binding protein
MYVIEAKNLIKEYRIGEVVTQALAGVSLAVSAGEFVSIEGRSGAGKSTLLYQLGLLDEPTSGEVLVKGNDTALLSEKERTQIRLSTFGYVFQDYALIPELTAEENVAIPLISQGCSFGKCYVRARDVLERVGLGSRLTNRPSQLSGGEQQRVSIARALVNSPHVLFADEPTANLDSETSEVVMDLFRELHEAGQTLVMVTHEPEYAQRAQRIISMSDGKIISSA